MNHGKVYLPLVEREVVFATASRQVAEYDFCTYQNHIQLLKKEINDHR